LREFAGDEFSLVSLSNRTVVYKGLSALSRLADLYPDLQNPDVESRYVVFHSRYCTNTTTAWRRAQPFWGIAHNGEIATIQGNVAWMNAIGKDLVRNLVDRNPSLARISAEVTSVVCPGGSDTADLDDMMIALMAGGMSFPQAMLALLPPATSTLPENDPLQSFARAAGVYLGACDGPAAIVGCDGDHAVAHLDRNGLRPLWVQTSRDYVLAVSELTGTTDIGDVEVQRVMGPGDTVVVELSSGRVYFDDAVRREVARHPFPSPDTRIVEGRAEGQFTDVVDLTTQQRSFGMTREDVDVLIRPLAETAKPALGSMGDDTSPAAMLDDLPRRLEDHFALRFAQETSPPIDPIRDAWVFDTSAALGDRSGMWSVATGPVYTYPHRILSRAELGWLGRQRAVRPMSLLFSAAGGEAALEDALEAAVECAARMAEVPGVIVLTDRTPDRDHAALPPLRVVSRVHRRLVALGLRNRVGIVADVGVWDIHHCALLVTLGADAVCPWLGEATAAQITDASAEKYLKGIRSGFVEVMSMMGVTPASAYCGAALVESIGLDHDLVREEFPGVPHHLGGIGRGQLDREWLGFHAAAFDVPGALADAGELVDAGEFRHAKGGRRHANNAELVRSLHLSSGFAKKIHGAAPGSQEAFEVYRDLVNSRPPVTVLDLLELRKGSPIALNEVESEERILWRFMAPGMSEGAISGPAHRTVARAFNVLYRYCRIKLGGELPGIGPVANSGEGGFDKDRIGTRDGNRSVQYAGGRFTITPSTAARAAEAEVKFAQGAKPGKGGQLPGKKVSERVARQRGCEPGYELVSPPINHNLYSIEDVKLMLESWRHLNPEVNCALKYVATYGVEMVAAGGVNAGANRLHLSDGCGGTGAAKRVDQKHAGVPVAAVLPTVHDMLVEEDVRHLVEISVDGGIQTGAQALKLFLLGADRVGFGTSLLIAIGCSMLRKCHLSGPDPADPSGRRRLGCTPGVATQDPALVAKFAGDWRHVVRLLRFVAREIREELAQLGYRSVSEVVGRRDLLERRQGLSGKAALLDLRSVLSAPHAITQGQDLGAQTRAHMPALRRHERAAAESALAGQTVTIIERLTNESRCVGVGAAGIFARAKGDLGLPEGGVHFVHSGSAGHYYGAYSVEGLEFRLHGVVADSCFTAAYGGLLALAPADGQPGYSLVGNAFGYGARGGRAYIAGRGGNRFGICLRQSHERTGPRIVVEGVEANAFQYMTGGVALVLGPTGPNLGSGMTGGCVYLLDADPAMLNSDYVDARPLSNADEARVREMLAEHIEHTDSYLGRQLLDEFARGRYSRIATILKPEPIADIAPPVALPI
jgi:glutamate synthase domain-containing protein 2/glutamate synthase domain-containing protein 3